MVNEQRLREDLRGKNSRDTLTKIYADEERRAFDQSKKFFDEYLPEVLGETYNRRGLGTRLSENPFSKVTVKTWNCWLRGEEKISRAAAHQLCIFFELGLENSKVFFNFYLGTELTRYNEWTEVFYRYCIEKSYDINQAFELHNRCIEEVGLNDKDAGMARKNQEITIMTSDIKKAFNMETFINEEKFIEYMKAQKEKFHNIRSTRRRKILEIIEAIKTPELLADAFFIDRDEIEDNEDAEEGKFKYPNDEYFKDYIRRIKNREANFSREFLILSLLAKGINKVWDIEDVLTSEYIDFMSLDVNNTFDACVYEACEHSDDTNLSAYYRFYENMQLIKYKRPKTFASNYY